MTDRIIASGDVHLATRATGPEDGVPVLLVMGATASMLWWPEELCDGLAARGLRVIRYDNRDTGASTSGPPGAPSYAVEDMAGDLLVVMDAYGLRAAHVVGMSLGALIAQVAAVAAPERVLSLTLIAAEPLGWTGEALPGIAPEFMDHFAAMGHLDWSDGAAVEEFLLGIARLSAGGLFDEGRERARVRAEMARAPDMRTAFNHGVVALREDWSGRLRDVACPVTVIQGTSDPIVAPANGKALVSAMPGARLVLLDGVGHELPLRALPQIVAEVAAQVLGRAPT